MAHTSSNYKSAIQILQRFFHIRYVTAVLKGFRVEALRFVQGIGFGVWHDLAVLKRALGMWVQIPWPYTTDPTSQTGQICVGARGAWAISKPYLNPQK